MTDFSGSQQEGGNHAAKIHDWLEPRRFCLILAILVIIPFHQVLLGGQTFVIRDFGLFSYPVAYYLKESFWRGEIPLWNPMSYCGVPFLAQFNTLTLYPLSLIYCLLPLQWALPFFCLLHLYLAGLGMYFLARRWSGSNLGGAIAGVVFAFNGLSLSMLMWPSHTAGYALMPWTVFFAETAWKKGGRHLIIAAIVCALQVLTGSPEEILFSWILMAILALVHLVEKQNAMLPLALRFVGVGILAAGLSAPGWLPFLDFTTHSQRDAAFAGSEWSMPLFGWANFFVPLYQTQRWQTLVVQVSQYWTSSYYLSVAAIFLATIAIVRRPNLRVILLGVGLLLSVVLAFGDAGYVYGWLRHTLPFLGMFRYPVKFVLLTAFVAPLLASYAIAHFETRKHWSLEWAVAGVVLALIALVVYLGNSPAATVPWKELLHNAAWRAGFFVAAVIALLLLTQNAKRRPLSIGLLIVLVWADLLTHVPWQNPSGDSSLFQPGLARMKVQLNPEPTLGESRMGMSPEVWKSLYHRPTDEPVPTFLVERITFLGNLNLLDNLAKADGFFSLNTKHTDTVLHSGFVLSSNSLEHLEDVLAISQTIQKTNSLEWVPRTSFLPIVTAGQEPVFDNDLANLKAICNPSADIRHTVYLPLEAKDQVKAKREDRARIVEKHFGYNNVSVTVDTPTPAMTSITQSYYHNWKAYVDGAATKLWRANYAFQAVEIPAGKHELKLVYEDTAYSWGCGLFAVTAVACAGVWTLASKRNKTTPAPA